MEKERRVRNRGLERSLSKRSQRKSCERRPQPDFFRGIPKELPSLRRAYLMTERASNVGFDWPDLSGILKKLDEELREFHEALSLRNRKRIREEIGDLLFIMVNIGRFLGIHPEEALKRTVEKFTSRFHYIETSLHKQGKSLQQSSLMEMDRLWEEAKMRKRGPVK